MSSDHTRAPLSFKIRKAVRYMRLFGLSRTLTKVKGQYHVESTAEFTGDRWDNPKRTT